MATKRTLESTTDGHPIATKDSESAAQMGAKPESRHLIKGHLKPPKRNPLPPSYSQKPVLQNELVMERPGVSTKEPIVIDVQSTAVPQPFVNPETPLGRHGL